MRFGPNLKRYLPRALFTRTLLIILLPLAVAQGVATWMFYDRLYQAVTGRLAQSVAGDVRLLRQTLTSTTRQNWSDIFSAFRSTTGLDASYNDGELPSGVGANDLMRRTLGDILSLQSATYRFGAMDDDWFVLFMPVDSKGYLTIRIPQRRLYTPNATVFIGWMIGATAFLVLISLIFMRNQIRPIRRLADAAEKFGRGLDVAHFKPEGALEVRQAAAAFLVMRNRLRRMIEQRTEMLAAISHDLRTPLTRMRLELALLPAGAEASGLEADISEMEKMIEAYLAFARGEDSEKAEEIDMRALVSQTATQATRFGKPIWWQAPAMPLIATVRPAAIRRAVTNLVSNAVKYGNEVWVTVAEGDYTIEVVIEDNGPGIPAEARERVFKPFFRLGYDAAQNDEIDIATPSSYGLGLTIARDIARAHGGDITLGQSSHGGLKATLRLPT